MFRRVAKRAGLLGPDLPYSHIHCATFAVRSLQSCPTGERIARHMVALNHLPWGTYRRGSDRWYLQAICIAVDTASCWVSAMRKGRVIPDVLYIACTYFAATLIEETQMLRNTCESYAYVSCCRVCVQRLKTSAVCRSRSMSRWCRFIPLKCRRGNGAIPGTSVWRPSLFMFSMQYWLPGSTQIRSSVYWPSSRRRRTRWSTSDGGRNAGHSGCPGSHES